MREDKNDNINIEYLKLFLREELKTKTAIQDFVVMTYLIGNDFLPHLPIFGDLQKAFNVIFDVYKTVQTSLIQGDKLNWDGLALFFQELARREPSLLTDEGLRDIINPLPLLQNSLISFEIPQPKLSLRGTVRTETDYGIDYQKFRTAWYDRIFLPHDNIQLDDILPSDFLNSTPEEIEDLTYNYLVGLEWTFRYYNQGHSNVNLRYLYQYHYRSPSF